ECRKNYAGAKSRGCGRMMSENKLNNLVWRTITSLITNPDKIKSHQNRPQKNYIHEEINHIKEHIEKNRTGRKRLLTLVSISQDDDINIGEIKEKIRELQQQAKRLESKLKVLQQNVFEKEKKQQTKFVLEDALHYYITGKCKELRV